eukprot:scaffold283554_cov26-Tisochrysis_lutea.AAC.1
MKRLDTQDAPPVEASPPAGPPWTPSPGTSLTLRAPIEALKGPRREPPPRGFWGAPWGPVRGRVVQ